MAANENLDNRVCEKSYPHFSDEDESHDDSENGNGLTENDRDEIFRSDSGGFDSATQD